MSLQDSLEKIHKKAISNYWLKLFAAILRGWLAFAFIQAGGIKANHKHFSNIPGSEPIGAFFNAFFHATEYYIFVGAVQVMAGILLLFSTTTALGAILYFPVILNIFFITVAFSFNGTWIITGLMLLANIFLLCWEFEKWQALVPGFGLPNSQFTNKHLGFFSTILASAVSALLITGIIFTILGIIKESNILLPILIVVVSLMASGYLLFKYRSNHVQS